MENRVFEPEVRDEHEQPLTTSSLASSLELTTARTEPSAENRTDGAAPLFAHDESQNFRTRWEKIQSGFVDEPRQSVEDADALVATVIKRLAEVFASERTQLENEWAKGDNASTEDLRVALRRYRSFFDRLLSV
jgi:hypothetical protein